MDENFEYVGNELTLFKAATNWKHYFTGKLKNHVKGDVLEVGSGIGANTPFFIKSSRKVKSWTLVEPDKELFKIAEQSLIRSALLTQIEIKHINGTIENISGKKFDTILYIDVIEHIENAEKELKRAASKLKKEGNLIVLVPAYQHLFNEFDESIGHFRRYNKKLLMDHAGVLFNKNKMFYLDSLGYFAGLANKWFLKKAIPSTSNVYLWDKTLIPLSRLIDKVVFFSFGKSLIGIFSNDVTK